MSRLADQARSIGARLSRISKERGVAYLNVLTEFLLERLVVRLTAKDAVGAKLVFKGGYVSLRIYESPRYTVDLDALLQKGDLRKFAQTAKAAAETDLGDGVWFRLEKMVDLQTQGEYGGLRLAFRSGVGEILPDIKRAQIINLDIGFGDVVTPASVEVDTPFLLGEGALSWRVYPPETMVAEKLHALITRGSDNSRSKDIFDLNLLLPRCKPQFVQKALEATFASRESPLPKDILAVLSKIDRKLLKMGWASAVNDLPEKPDFDEQFDQMLDLLARG